MRHDIGALQHSQHVLSADESRNHGARWLQEPSAPQADPVIVRTPRVGWQCKPVPPKLDAKRSSCSAEFRCAGLSPPVMAEDCVRIFSHSCAHYHPLWEHLHPWDSAVQLESSRSGPLSLSVSSSVKSLSNCCVCSFTSHSCNAEQVHDSSYSRLTYSGPQPGNCLMSKCCGKVQSRVWLTVHRIWSHAWKPH